MTEANGPDSVQLILDQKKALHDERVQKGLLPPDSPEDFVIPEGCVNENGLPWWFPPDFKAGDVMIDGRPAKPLDLNAWNGVKEWPDLVRHMPPDPEVTT